MGRQRSGMAQLFRGWEAPLLGVALLAGLASLGESAALVLVLRLLESLLRGEQEVSLGARSWEGGLALSRSQVGLAALAALLFRLVLLLLEANWAARLVARFAAGLRRDLIARSLQAHLVAPLAEGRLLATLSINTQSLGRAMEMMTRAVSHGAAAALLLLPALLLSWPATLGLMALGGLVALTLRPLSALARRITRRVRDLNLAFGQYLSELVTSARDARVFGIADALRARHERLLLPWGRQVERSDLVRGAVGPSFEALGTLGLLAIAAGLARLGLLDPSALPAFALLARALQLAQSAWRDRHQAQEALPYLAGLEELRRHLQATDHAAGGLPLGPQDGLTLRQVGFRWPDGSPALHPLSLDLPIGRRVAVIGPSGSGKSTLGRIVLGVLTPTEGAARVGDRALAEIAPQAWRSSVATLVQRPEILPLSVRDNVTLRRTGYGDAAVTRALEEAGLTGWLATLPSGLDTPLDRERLSGGQAQRLALARALLGEPRLLVLDEPTAALDPTAEATVLEALARRRATTAQLLIAHRLETTLDSDWVLVLAEGKVQAEGRPEELRRQGWLGFAAPNSGTGATHR